jgi:hypothetical protein
MKRLGALLKADADLQREFNVAVESRIGRERKKYEWAECEYLRTIARLKAENSELRADVERMRAATMTAR